MGFQRTVNNQPGVAAVGDFADANIRASVIAGAGALVAAGVDAVYNVRRNPIVGQFAWGDQRDPGTGVGGLAFSRYFGETTAKIGFVHRENNAIIVPFLAESQMYLEQGQIITLFDQGSFWAKFVDGADVGQKVFANYLDGSVYADDAGASTESASFTGVIQVTTGILTASAVTGAIKAGDVLTGVGVPVGTSIISQLSGTIGGAGTYQTSITTAVGSVAMLANDAVETAFYVDSPADAGELAKISTWG